MTRKKKSNLLTARALRRLRGQRQVGLDPATIRRNLLQGTGPERERQWPRNAAGFNPLARAADAATANVKSLPTDKEI